MVSHVANGLMEWMRTSCGIQSWLHFLPAKFSAISQGLVYTAPSSAAALQMHGEMAFSLFINSIFVGISYAALAGVYLKAARGDEMGWMDDAVSNFARPLDCAWLLVSVLVRIVLWTLLLVVPGIVAVYRG